MVKKNNSYSFFKHTNNFAGIKDAIFSEYVNIDGKDGYYLPKSNFPTIQPNDSIQYDGNIFLLINEESFSASTIFAGLFKKTKRGIIIGRETGSTYHQQNGGKFAEVILAKTRLILRIPLIKGIFNKKTDLSVPWGRGVIPDYTVKPTFEEFVSNEDKIMTLTLNLIENLRESEELKIKRKNEIHLLSWHY